MSQSTVPAYDDVAVGTELPAQTFQVQRLDLIRYAGASGDFNVIHWNERVATSVGLPNVIAHGMFTMAIAARVVTDWAGDPGAVVDYGVRFTRPVPVPDDDAGATVEVTGSVAVLLEDKRVRVDLKAVHAGTTVLGRAQAVVQLA
jgi:acyl dehydratase